MKFLQLPAATNHVLLLAVVIALGGVSYTTCCMFVFRYAQTSGSPHVGRLSDMKLYTICYLGFCALIIVLVYVPMTLEMLNETQLRSAMQTADVETYYRLQGKLIAIGFNVGLLFTVYSQ